jgi:hypothetical protein
MFVVGKNKILKHNLDVLYVVRAQTKIIMKFKQNFPCADGEMFRFCPDSFADSQRLTGNKQTAHLEGSAKSFVFKHQSLNI